MTARPSLEHALTDWLRSDAPERAPVEVLAIALERVADVGQERYLAQRLLGDRLGRSRGLRLAMVMVLVAAALAGALAVAGSYRPLPAPSRAAGAFLPGPTLLMGRPAYTVTRLADGRVLVVGGQGVDGPVPAADATELWDPASGDAVTFVRGGPLRQARSGHTATLLPDGRVLVVGGEGTGGILSSAEVWDPTSGAYQAAGELTQARTSHRATLLPDGRVLIAGGRTGETASTNVATLETWDPRTSASSEAGSLRSVPSLESAQILHDGRVLLMGEATSELWDPVTGATTSGPSLVEPRSAYTVTVLQDGRVLVTGGVRDGDARSSAELWEPGSETFVPAGPLYVPRAAHSATLLADGRVLVAGGDDSGSAEVFDPTTDTFALTDSMLPGWAGVPTATLLEDGRVLLVGEPHSIPGRGTGISGASTQIWAADAQPLPRPSPTPEPSGTAVPVPAP